MMTVDHVGFAVADYERIKAFYLRPSFFIEAYGEPARGRLHIALAAESRAQVDAFHAAAIEAGGTDNGAPGVRATYHPDYYGGYVLDPDGNYIEAVCHRPE